MQPLANGLKPLLGYDETGCIQTGYIQTGYIQTGYTETDYTEAVHLACNLLFYSNPLVMVRSALV
jgi:hypothetical protein